MSFEVKQQQQLKLQLYWRPPGTIVAIYRPTIWVLLAIWSPYKSRPTLSAIGAKTLQPLFEWTEISSGRSLSCCVHCLLWLFSFCVCVCVFFSVTFVIYNYSWAIVIIDWLESCAQHTVTRVSSTHTHTHSHTRYRLLHMHVHCTYTICLCVY